MNYTISYLGAVVVEADVLYSTADIISKYATAEIVKIKTKNAKVSVNDSPMFEVTFDEVVQVEVGNNWRFDRQVILAVGKKVN